MIYARKYMDTVEEIIMDFLYRNVKEGVIFLQILFCYFNSKWLCSSTSLFWQSLISKTMSRVLFQILVPNFMVIINMNVRSMPKNVRTHCMEIKGQNNVTRGPWVRFLPWVILDLTDIHHDIECTSRRSGASIMQVYRYYYILYRHKYYRKVIIPRISILVQSACRKEILRNFLYLYMYMQKLKTACMIQYNC